MKNITQWWEITISSYHIVFKGWLNLQGQTGSRICSMYGN